MQVNLKVRDQSSLRQGMVWQILNIDQDTKQVLDAFRMRLERRYGIRLKSIFLFSGGDFRQDSDADVVVFLDHVSEPIREQVAICDDAYDIWIWMEKGIRVEPWVFEEASLAAPDKYRAARLVKKTYRWKGCAYNAARNAEGALGA